MGKFIRAFLVAGMLLLISLTVSALTDYTLIGNKVFINDTNLYLSAEPHTLSSTQDVKFNLMTKSFSGNIDIVFGFNVSNAYPSTAMFKNPHNITTTTNHSYTCLDYFNYTLYPKHFWCYDIIVTYDNLTNQTILTYQLAYDHSFDTGNLTAKTAYWSETVTTHYEYSDVSDSFTKIAYNYGGMNTWYYAKNIPVTAGKNYELKSLVNIPIKIGENNGKYWVCTKPSSETIAQAIANSHLYCLDPWWNSSYPYRRTVNFTSSWATQSPYMVRMDINSSTMPTTSNWNWANLGRDLAITNSSESVMNFWIENWTSTSTTIWVNMTSILNGVNQIYVYYGGANLSLSLINSSFPYANHFYNAIDTTFWTLSGTPTIANSMMIVTEDIRLTKTVNIVTNISFRARINISTDVNARYGLASNVADFSSGLYLHSWAYSGTIYHQNAAIQNTTAIVNGMKTIEWKRSSNFYEGSLDNSNYGNITESLPTTNMQIYLRQGPGAIDWFFFRPYISPDPTQTSIGAEETGTPANTAPTINNITVAPITPHVNENINWSINVSDAENATVAQCEYMIYNGTTSTFNGNITAITGKAQTQIFYLTARNISVNEVWNITTRCKDDTTWGNYNSSTVTILNDIPTITNISVTPINPYTNDNILWSSTCQDNENTTVQVEYNIYNGSVLKFYGNVSGVANATSTLIFTLSAANTTKGETWNMTARCWDSSNWSFYNSSRVTILNSIPTTPILATPLNATNTSDNTPYLDWYNSTDNDSDIINYQVQISDSLAFTNINYSGNVTTNSTTVSSTLPSSVYYWRVLANTTDANSSFSTIWQFRVDATAPSLAINKPSANSNFSTRTIELNITASDSASGLSTCGYSINNFATNTTFSNCTSVNVVFSSDGNFNISVFANDTLGNTATAKTNVSIDTLPPAININLPLPNSNYSSTSVELNVTITDIGIGTGVCWYSLNNLTTNTTFTNCSSVLITGGEGKNNLYVGANDTLGNSNTSQQVNFTIDTTAPAITNPMVNISSGTINDSVKINATVIDNSTITSVKLYLCTPLNCCNLTASVSNNEYYYLITSSTSCNTSTAGMYNYTSAWATDSFGNIKSTSFLHSFNLSFTTTGTPVVLDANISPTTVYTNGKLFCNASVGNTTGANGIYWRTYNNSVLVTAGSGTATNLVLTNYINITTLKKGESWKCGFIANNGTTNSSELNTTTITVSNTAPSAPATTTMTPAQAYTGDTFTCAAAGATDTDGDSLTYYYRFRDTDNSTILQAYSTTATFPCTTAGCNKNDMIYCHAKAYDGTAYGSEKEANSSVLNSVPTLPTQLTLANGASTTDTTPTFTWTASVDNDSDAITYGIEICDDNACASINQSSYVVATNTYTATALNISSYYWRIFSITADANSSRTSLWIFSLTAPSVTTPETKGDPMNWNRTNTADYNTLMSGDVVHAVYNMMNSKLGGFFFPLLLLLLCTMAYLKSQNVVIPAIIALLFSGFALQYLPAVTPLILYVFIALGVAAILYKFAKPGY